MHAHASFHHLLFDCFSPTRSLKLPSKDFYSILFLAFCSTRAISNLATGRKFTVTGLLSLIRSVHYRQLFDRMPLRPWPHGRDVRRPARGPGACDRISGLPDDVLRHVLSVLDSRRTVQTCVLSPRWRSLWQTLPCVNAEFFEFCDFNRSEEEITRSEPVFKKFVNHLLSACEPSAWTSSGSGTA